MPEKKMVNLVIDDKEVTVPEGTLIVDAAKKIGIDIPVFCYHPKLEPVGMCRMCLVEIGRPVMDRATGQLARNDDGSVKIQFAPKLDTACTTPVSEGMVVRGMTEKVTAARKDIIEFLLTSHPLDCPICDKGGECPLQNLTLRHGQGTSRYLFDEKMRLAKHVPLGELIYLDRERCIQCGRCVRFQDEVVDDPVIGFYQRGRSLEIVTYSEPGFDSYFSGNTTDICPVGALATADFRFEARPWELNSAASICTQCPVGCNLTLNVRREARSGGATLIKRVMPRQNEAVNEIWICDKGRFGYHYSQAKERLDQPMVRKDGRLVPASWDEALQRAAEGFREAGAEALILAGGRLANEDLFNLRQLAEHSGGQYALYGEMGGGDLVQQYGLTPGSNLKDLGKGSAILVVASDLQEEAPVWWLRVKQAADRGATLIVANPRQTKLDKAAAISLRYAYGEETALLESLMPGSSNGHSSDAVVQAAQALKQAENLVIFYGHEGTGLASSQALAEACANLLQATGHFGRTNNGLVAVWMRANEQGAWDMGFRPAVNLQDAISHSKALLIAGADPAGDYPSLAEAVDGLDFLVVQELFMTATAEKADVVLPAQPFSEREGSYTNGERRVQRFYQGLATRIQARTDFAIAAQIGKLLGADLQERSTALVMRQIAAVIPDYAGITYEKLSAVEPQEPIIGRKDLYYGGTGYQNRQGLGVQLPNREHATPWVVTQPSQPGKLAANGRDLLAVPIDRLYDHGTTLDCSGHLLGKRMTPAMIALHPQEAEKRGLAAGEKAEITLDGLTRMVLVSLDESTPLGTALVPRSTGLPVNEPIMIKVARA